MEVFIGEPRHEKTFVWINTDMLHHKVVASNDITEVLLYMRNQKEKMEFLIQCQCLEGFPWIAYRKQNS